MSNSISLRGSALPKVDSTVAKSSVDAKATSDGKCSIGYSVTSASQNSNLLENAFHQLDFDSICTDHVTNAPFNTVSINTSLGEVVLHMTGIYGPNFKDAITSQFNVAIANSLTTTSTTPSQTTSSTTKTPIDDTTSAHTTTKLPIDDTTSAHTTTKLPIDDTTSASPTSTISSITTSYADTTGTISPSDFSTTFPLTTSAPFIGTSSYFPDSTTPYSIPNLPTSEPFSQTHVINTINYQVPILIIGVIILGGIALIIKNIDKITKPKIHDNTKYIQNINTKIDNTADNNYTALNDKETSSSV